MSRAVVALAAGLVLLAGCGTSTAPKTAPTTAPTTVPTTAVPTTRPAVAVPHEPLRKGERIVTVRMASAYTPSAPTGKGTDDYRCFLLDPHVAKSSFVTGFNILPGSPKVVHHVIMFRVPPDQVAAAEQKDAETPGEGWTCFGNSGLGNDLQIDDAPWLGAWAPGGSEQEYGAGLGEPFPAGSRVIMQVHYNLLAGDGPDTSAAALRLTSDPGTKALLTRLVPAPVELPCAPGHTSGPLCSRAAALADVKARFGDGPGSTADLLHLLCGPIKPGPVQSCTRTIGAPETVRGVAGHMHLLGRAIKIVVDQGTPRAKTILDITNWDFDNQGSHPIAPVHLKAFDTVTVTCRHDQTLHDQLPAFAGQPQKYVVWGEGTTDEMCLGILLVTRP